MSIVVLPAAIAAPITTAFSSSYVTTLTGVMGSGVPPVRLIADQGSPTGASTSATLQISDVDGFRQASARADLASGTLGVSSGVRRILNDNPLAVSATSGQPGFGDSFAHSASAGAYVPFQWTTTSRATFNFGIEGNSVFTGGANDVDTAIVYLDIFKPGTLGRNLRRFGVDPQAYTIDTQSPTLAGDLLYDAAFGLTPTSTTFLSYLSGTTIPVTAIIEPSGSSFTPFSFQFDPGSDFDWVITMVTNNTLHGGDPDASAYTNFGNTLTVAYVPPAGAFTYSASGLFPNTLAIGAVPEPSVGLLIGAGLLSLGSRMRRSRGSASRPAFAS